MCRLSQSRQYSQYHATDKIVRFLLLYTLSFVDCLQSFVYSPECGGGDFCPLDTSPFKQTVSHVRIISTVFCLSLTHNHKILTQTASACKVVSPDHIFFYMKANEPNEIFILPATTTTQHLVQETTFPTSTKEIYIISLLEKGTMSWLSQFNPPVVLVALLATFR